MRVATTLLCLLPGLALAHKHAHLPSHTTSSSPTTTEILPSPTPDLELREIVNNLGQTQGTSEANAVTTYGVWENGQYVEIAYTLTFASVPDQWPTPSSGTIGLGTISGTVGVVKTKREAEPTPAPEQKAKRAVNAADTLVAKAGTSSGLAFAIAIAALIAF